MAKYIDTSHLVRHSAVVCVDYAIRHIKNDERRLFVVRLTILSSPRRRRRRLVVLVHSYSTGTRTAVWWCRLVESNEPPVASCVGSWCHLPDDTRGLRILARRPTANTTDLAVANSLVVRGKVHIFVVVGEKRTGFVHDDR